MVVPITPRIRRFDDEFGVAARERYRKKIKSDFAKFSREELHEIVGKHQRRNSVSRFFEWLNDGFVGYGCEFSKPLIEYEVARYLLKPVRYVGS